MSDCPGLKGRPWFRPPDPRFRGRGRGSGPRPVVVGSAWARKGLGPGARATRVTTPATCTPCPAPRATRPLLAELETTAADALPLLTRELSPPSPSRVSFPPTLRSVLPLPGAVRVFFAVALFLIIKT